MRDCLGGWYNGELYQSAVDSQYSLPRQIGAQATHLLLAVFLGGLDHLDGVADGVEFGERGWEVEKCIHGRKNR